jgi:stress response protein YsnF
MDGHNVVAVYGLRDEAERARDRLIEDGIPANEIRISAAEPGVAAGTSDLAGGTGLAGGTAAAAPRREGFWDWLFGRDMPERDRSWYESNLREGRTVLSVFVRDAEQHRRVADILEEFDPIDFDEGDTATADRLGAGTMPLGAGAASGVAGASYSDADRPVGTDASLGSPEAWSRRDEITTAEQRAEGVQRTGEQVIPVTREELSVGKRATERRYRIRTYIVETPVEQEVTLRDERVIVEHRPVSGAAATTAQMPQEREFEVVERHEEPVVEKRARNVEEVVVRTDANERTETVRDTVRQTRVDVENEAGGRADNLERTIPEDRKP